MMFAVIAQLGERQTEDLKVPGSIPGLGTFLGDRSQPAITPVTDTRKMTLAGLEPAIFGSEDQRLIH